MASRGCGLNLCSSFIVPHLDAEHAVKTLQRARQAAGIGTEHITDPAKIDRRDRVQARGTSIRTVSGGLPTLGRDR